MSVFIKSHILVKKDFFCWLVRKFPSTLGIRWVLPVFKGIQKNNNNNNNNNNNKIFIKILLVSWEGCDRVTDIDCTECTCGGQVVR